MKYGYVRVASDAGSIDRQVQTLMKCGIDKWYIDISSGISITKCLQLQNMLNELKEGDSVYVTELSRISRNICELQAARKYFRKNNIKIVVVNHEHTSDNSVIIEKIAEALYRYEKEIFSEDE